MISVIITAKNEERTIERAVVALGTQNFLGEEKEILVVAPDQGTLNAAQKANEEIITILDKGVGKPAALNLALTKAKGERLIFSDGDVAVAPGAIEKLLKSDAVVASGRPIVESDGDDLFGFWQKVLFEEAHKMRASRLATGKYFPVSGYLFLAKKENLSNFEFPGESLAEDEYLSYVLWQRGIKIGYEPEAKVLVKGPRNFQDWARQKIRTLGASYQVPKSWKKGVVARSFFQESKEGWRIWQEYGDSGKHKGWLLLLFGARLYVWLVAKYRVAILKQKREQVWQRVESTK